MHVVNMMLWYPDCSRRKRCDAKASGRKLADTLQLSAPSDFASPAENSLIHGIFFWGQLSSGGWVRQGNKDLTVLTPNRTLWWASVVPEPPIRLANTFGPASQFAFFLILLPLSSLTDRLESINLLIPNKYLVPQTLSCICFWKTQSATVGTRGDLRKEAIKRVFWNKIFHHPTCYEDSWWQVEHSESLAQDGCLIVKTFTGGELGGCTSGREHPKCCNLLGMWWLWMKY